MNIIYCSFFFFFFIKLQLNGIHFNTFRDRLVSELVELISRAVRYSLIHLHLLHFEKTETFLTLFTECMYTQYCTYRFQKCDLMKALYLKMKYFLFGVSSQICLRKTDSIHNTIHSQNYKMLEQKVVQTLLVLLV